MLCLLQRPPTINMNDELVSSRYVSCVIRHYVVGRVIECILGFN